MLSLRLKKQTNRNVVDTTFKDITDNKKLWKTLKPLVSDKGTCRSSKINLVVDDENLSDDKEVAETFNNYFNNAVKSLNLQCYPEHLNDVSDENDPIELAVKKFKNHPSIVNINKNIPKTATFSFDETETDSIKKIIDNLDSRKSGIFGGIPANCLKVLSDISAKFLHTVWNDEVLTDLKFPCELKLSDGVPAFKKEDSALGENYKPIILLPIISKIFERIMLNQITTSMNEYLSPYLYGYMKDFNTETALSSLIEKWKQIIENKGYGAAILMDLSRAFDTINQELLIAKLHAFDFTRESLFLDSSLSSWTKLTQGVPQISALLGSFLFNIYLNGLFFALKDIEFCNFADDATPFVCGLDLNTTLNKLEENSAIALTWFETNYMKLNSDKCHLLVSIHYQNIHRLAAEIYKVANDLSVREFKNLFNFKDRYTVHIPLVNTEMKGKNSIRYFGAVIWNAVPINIKTATSLNDFKNSVKSWKPECPSPLCKTFLQVVGFLNITEQSISSASAFSFGFNNILHILLYFFFDI